MPVPTKYCVFVKSSSVFLMKASPATLRKTLSTPLTEASEELANPEVRAQGLTKRWLAPAAPDLSGFPANAEVSVTKRIANVKIVFFMIVIRFPIRSYLSQRDALPQTTLRFFHLCQGHSRV